MDDVKVIDHGFAAMLKRIDQLNGEGVKVGIQHDSGKEADGTELVDVAIFNEFGTDKIPARPFVRTMVDVYAKEAGVRMDAASDAVLTGKIQPEQALGLVGEWAQARMKKNLLNYAWVPNAPSTIKRKKSNKPLVDTGKLLGAIRWEKL